VLGLATAALRRKEREAKTAGSLKYMVMIVDDDEEQFNLTRGYREARQCLPGVETCPLYIPSRKVDPQMSIILRAVHRSIVPEAAYLKPAT
jgi:hypothetical protein